MIVWFPWSNATNLKWIVLSGRLLPGLGRHNITHLQFNVKWIDISGIIEKFNVYVTSAIILRTKHINHQRSELSVISHQNIKLLFIREKNFTLIQFLLEKFVSSTITQFFRKRLFWMRKLILRSANWLHCIWHCSRCCFITCTSTVDRKVSNSLDTAKVTCDPADISGTVVGEIPDCGRWKSGPCLLGTWQVVKSVHEQLLSSVVAPFQNGSGDLQAPWLTHNGRERFF